MCGPEATLAPCVAPSPPTLPPFEYLVQVYGTSPSKSTMDHHQQLYKRAHHQFEHQPPHGESSLDSSPVYSDLSSPSFSTTTEQTFDSPFPSPHETQESPQGQHVLVSSTTSSHQTLQQQRNPFIGRSACVVCSDRARGCNFGAITCASCKEFFRRNAFKFNVSKLKCYFQNKCDINIYSRRFCAACRLSKCYQMGMKSEYIMSDAEKYERQLKIIERKLSTRNRLLALNVHGEEIDGEGTIYSPYTPGANQSEKSEESFFVGQHNQLNGDQGGYNQRLIKEEPPIDVLEQLASSSFLSPSFAPSDTLPHNHHLYSSSGFYLNSPELKRDPSDWPYNISPDSTCLWTPDQISNYPQAPPPPPPPSYTTELDEPESVSKLLRKVKIIRESNFYPTKFQLLVRAHSAEKSLTQNERCKLKYLTSVIQIMQAEIITELPTDQKCIDLMKIAEVVTFCFIKMCKKLYAFQALSQEDQVGLVKGRVVKTLVLWSIMSINLEKECWEALDLERNIKFSLKMELLKEANKKLYEEHRRYAMSFDPEWRFNDNLMSLLLAIALFDADKSEISNVQAIRTEQTAYCLLLKNYVATLYEDGQVEEMYSRLLGQLEFTEQISESHIKAYFDVSPNEMTKNGFGGLIMEIFDLNN